MKSNEQISREFDPQMRIQIARGNTLMKEDVDENYLNEKLKVLVSTVRFLKSDVEKCWVIRMEGTSLKLRTGKSMWKKKGLAKAALISHFDNSAFYRNQLRDIGFNCTKGGVDFLLQEEILKIEEI